jgi:hypothetical protein
VRKITLGYRRPRQLEAQRITRSNLIVGISAAMLIAVVVTVGVAVARNPTNSSQSNQQVITNVQNSPEIPLAVDNSESPPVGIQIAGAKEITGEVFQQLTGLSPNSSQYITVPNLTLLNNTNKTITAVVLALEDNRSNEHDGLFLTGLSIAPAGQFAVAPMDWAVPRKNMLKKYVTQGSDVQADTSEPTITSQEMWLAGSISNFSITIGRVEFADGTAWMTQR